MELPTGRLTKSLMLPEPLAVLPVAPPVAVLVYVTPVKNPGNTSLTVAPLIGSGPPLLVTTIAAPSAARRA